MAARLASVVSGRCLLHVEQKRLAEGFPLVPEGPPPQDNFPEKSLPSTTVFRVRAWRLLGRAILSNGAVAT